MPPAHSTLPDHFALRSIVLGSLLAMGFYHWQGHSLGESLHVLNGSLLVDSDGMTALEVLPRRCAVTMAWVLVAMLVSASAGIGMALFVVRWQATRWLSAPMTMIAQMMAAVPVVGLAWCGIAWLVNDAHLPIESLIPYSPPPDRDSRGLSVGRAVWSLAVPMWTMALPVLGLWLAASLDTLRLVRPLAFQTGLDARGVSPSQVAWQHWLRLAWVRLHQRWHSFGMIAFAWAIFVEDAFGIPGWGGFTARCLRERNIEGLASVLGSAAWMTALWYVLSWPIRRGIPREALPSTSWPPSQSRSAWWSAVILLAVLVVTLGLGSAGSWVNEWLFPWMADLLPVKVGDGVVAMWPQLMSDVHAAGVTVAVAVLISGLVGWCWALAARVKAWPRTLIIDTGLSGAFTATMLVFAIADESHSIWFWPALALGIQGGARLRDTAGQLRLSSPMLASRVAGTGVVTRWFRHAVPEMACELCAWAMHSLGTALLWILLIRSMVPRASASLGSTLAAAQSTALTQPDLVTQATALAALSVWCFWRLSRVLRAAPH